ncbi:MAG: ATPase, T2SS/T4P/T4SS family [Candidatus Aenigmatarchaeota archaeon]
MEIIESYKVNSEGIEANVSIKKTSDFVLSYELKFPEIGTGTSVLLDKIRAMLLIEIPIKPTELVDIASIENLKKKFFEKGLEILKKEMPYVDEKTQKYLVGSLMQEMFGLGKIEFLLADPNLEEVVINGSKEFVWVYHKKYGWLKTNLKIDQENEILNYANNIGRKVGRQITLLNPLMDAHLPTGDRVNATLFPISTCGNTITIRKFRRSPWTITDFIENKTLNYEVAALIWLAIQYEMNMIVAGGTASGKTSLLNVFMSFIPPNQRIVSIEDSVSGEEEIIIKDASGIKKLKIMELFETRKDDEFVPKDMEVLSMNKDGKIEFRRVKKVMRHKTSKPLYLIELASGKEIKVTGDHSLFALSNDLKIQPIEVKKLKIGSFIATPRLLPFEGNLKYLDLYEIFKDSKVFFKGEKLKEFLNSKEGRAFLIENIPTNLRSKRRDYRKKGFLNAKLTKILVENKKISKEELTIFKGKSNFPVKFEIDRDFAFLLGCWVGDGCYGKNSVIFTISDKEFLARLENFCKKYGLEVKKHSDGFSFMINSSLLKDLMVNLGFVGDSFTKKIPTIVFHFPEELKKEFLKGLFSAEGWVRRNEVSLVTYSEDLAKDLQTLLLNFGIVLRKKKCKDKMNKTFFECRISTQTFLNIFKEKINFEQTEKRNKLERIIKEISHSSSDIIPLPKSIYKELKHILKLKEKLSPNYWKSWHRGYLISNIGRDYLRNLIQENIQDIEKINNPINGSELIKLVMNDIFWDKIISIKKIENFGYVYDLSVEENENFVCNNIIAHNTRELQLPDFLHWVPLTTREPNPEGLGEVTMLNLLVNSLRMRPDRIIVGEIRRAREAEVLFEAMHTGHSVYATLHADTAEQALKRLINPPINVPESVIEALHLIAVAFRDRRLGIRRLFQLSEILPGSEKRGPQVNTLYRWKPLKDEILKENDSYRLVEEIRMHTGMSDEEIKENLEEKVKILKWFVKKQVKDLNSLGRLIAIYYSSPELISKAAEKNEDFEKVIKSWFG